MNGGEAEEPEEEWSWELFQELTAAIESHPGEIAYERWKPLQDFFLSVFRPNYEVLFGQLTTLSQDQMFEIMQNVRPPVFREQYTAALFRNVHNYLAAHEAMIEHAEELANRYKGTEFYGSFDARRRAVKALRESGILRGLRHRAMHETLLSHGYRLTFDNTPAGSLAHFTVRLMPSDLLRWSRWTARDLDYIETFGEDGADLVPLLQIPNTELDDLVVWMLDQFEHLHASDLEGLRALQDRLKRIYPRDIPDF